MNKPELRFPEFQNSGDWEEKELSNFIKERSDRAKETDHKNVLSVSNQYGFIPQTEQFSGRLVASKDLSNYKIVYRDMYAYNPSRINVGSIARLTMCSSGLVSPMYVVFSILKGLEYNYFDSYIETYKFKKDIKLNTSGSVRDTVNFNALSKFNIPLPPTLTEQEKIASCLTSLDSKIEAENKKLENLKAHKKSLLQNLFPQEGEKTPRLRFKDFSGDWEEKELSNFIKERSDRSKETDHKNVFSVSNQYGFIPQTEQFSGRLVASKDLSNYKIVYRDMYAYNPSRINVGSIARLTMCSSGLVSPMYVVFSILKGLEYNYFDSYIETYKFKKDIKLNTSGSVRDTVNFNALSKFNIPLPPTLTEQEKIASCLSSLDKSIYTQANKIELLKMHKQGLMQKLFPKV